MSALVPRRALERRGVLDALGSIALVVVGYVHLDLYRHGYRAIPVIGRLFAANAIASVVVAVPLLVGRQRLARLAGFAVAAGTVLAFVASRLPAGLFGFQERGLEPSPQAALSLSASLVAATVLALSLLSARRGAVGEVSLSAATSPVRRGGGRLP